MGKIGIFLFDLQGITNRMVPVAFPSSLCVVGNALAGQDELHSSKGL